MVVGVQTPDELTAVAETYQKLNSDAKHGDSVLIANRRDQRATALPRVRAMRRTNASRRESRVRGDSPSSSYPPPGSSHATHQLVEAGISWQWREP